MGRLVLSRRDGQSLVFWIGNTKVVATVLGRSRNETRVLIEAPNEVHIDREEIYERKMRGDAPPAVRTRAS